MDQVSFGVFDWIDRGTGPVNRLYEERLQLLEAADDAGFSATTSPSTMRPRWAWRRRRHCSSLPPHSTPRRSDWDRSSTCCRYTIH